MNKRKARAKNATPVNRPRRASQRKVVSLNLGEKKLHALMIEQCKNGGDYITVYRGSRVELIAAGVPEVAFPKGAKAVQFELQTLNACSTGDYERLTGSMQATPAGFELEVDWGNVMPYLQGSHPAVSELARMISIQVGDWAGRGALGAPDLGLTMRKLAAHPGSDYDPDPTLPPLEVSAEFQKALSDYASRLSIFVFRYCEVNVREISAVTRPPQALPLRLIVDNTKEPAHG